MRPWKAEPAGASSSWADEAEALVEVSEASTSSVVALTASAADASVPGGSDDEIQVWISYETSDGAETNTTIFRMMPTETVADVKLRVQARKGWFASQQRLSFGDMELEDAKTIELVARAAGIMSPGTADEESQHVHLSVRLSDIMNVHIKTLEGETTLSTQPETTTVRELKEAVSLMNGHLPDHQDVFLEGRMLQDESKPLAEISPMSRSPIVHVLVKRTTKVKILPNSGNEFELSISAAETVESLKRRIELAEGIRAIEHRVVHNGRYLAETASLASYGVDEDSVLVLEPVGRSCSRLQGEDLELDGVDESLRNCVAMLQQAQAGFDVHMAPCLASAGTGGAYFLLGPRGEKVAVFKPEDEEPNAENNPRGFMSSPAVAIPGTSGASSASSSGEGLRKGTLPGEGASREFAAYILDHGNVAQVPPTAMVRLKQTSNKKFASVNDWQGTQGKRGSIQMFVPFDSDCEEMGISRFATREVHKIALLDIRLANTDRNGSNVLVRRHEDSGEYSLVPIDHGYCLPGSLSDICFDWIYWPQANHPFDEELLAYIRDLDAERDLEKLELHGVRLRPECRLVFLACNALLKLGVSRGLTAYDIGAMMCRQTLQQSILEKMSHHSLKKLSKGRVQGTGKLQLHELEEHDLGDLYLKELEAQMRTYMDEVFGD